MFIGAIFLTVFVFILNGIFFGRLFLRFDIFSNRFLCSIIGFLAFSIGLYFIFCIFYLLKLSMIFYLSFFLIYQVILLILYGINWRYILVSRGVNWRHVAWYSISIVLFLVIAILNIREFKSQDSKIVIDYFNLIIPNIKNPIEFNHYAVDYTVPNVWNTLILNSFNLSNDQFALYGNISFDIIGCFFISNLFMALISEVNALGKKIVVLVIFLFILVLSLMFIESFFIINSWAIIISCLFFYVLTKCTKSNLYFIFLFIIIFSCSCSWFNSFSISFCMSIFSWYYINKNVYASQKEILAVTLPVLLVICWNLVPLIGAFVLIIFALIGFYILFCIILSLKFEDFYYSQLISKNVDKIMKTLLFCLLAFDIIWLLFNYNDIVFNFINIDAILQSHNLFIFSHIWGYEIDQSFFIVKYFDLIITIFFILLLASNYFYSKIKRKTHINNELIFASIAFILFYNIIGGIVTSTLLVRYNMVASELNLFICGAFFSFIFKLIIDENKTIMKNGEKNGKYYIESNC